MIIDKNSQKTTDNLPTMGWLNRQKLYSGDESTHTWQNHIKWYQSRKSKAVVWLMRRAARSMKYSQLLAEAQNFLLVQRKQALAVTWLLEIGHTAIQSQGYWMVAKRSLLQRAMHARRWAQTTDAAHAWLKNLAKGILDEYRMKEAMEDQIARARALAGFGDDDMSVDSMHSMLHPNVKKQADYATFYKLHCYNALAYDWLKARAKKSLEHCRKQDQVQKQLAKHAHRMLMHQLYTESARSWLKLAGERAFNYCIYRDDCMKFLFRRGQHALQYLINQETCLAWLIPKGKEAVRFMRVKDTAGQSLVEQGQRTLKYLNAREHAVAALTLKCQKAVALLIRQKKAIAFLRDCPKGVWAHEDKRIATQEWLEQRGKRSIEHLARKDACFKVLQHKAGRAAAALRRQNIAFTDLQQIGSASKLQRFIYLCKTPKHEKYLAKVQELRKQIVATDRKTEAERAKLSLTDPEARWKLELQECFDWIASTYTPAAFQGGPRPLIGRIGFLKLLKNGALLGVNKESALEYFKTVDAGTQCFVPFEMVWIWFQHQARVYEKKKIKAANGGSKGSSSSGTSMKDTGGTTASSAAPGPKKGAFVFSIREILSSEERAYITVMKRVNQEKIEFSSNYDWEEMDAKRKREGDYDSSSEEENDDDGLDDEALFSDPNYLKAADIGRMMKYLTKKKMAKEMSKREADWRAEQERKRLIEEERLKREKEEKERIEKEIRDAQNRLLDMALGSGSATNSVNSVTALRAITGNDNSALSGGDHSYSNSAHTPSSVHSASASRRGTVRGGGAHFAEPPVASSTGIAASAAIPENAPEEKANEPLTAEQELALLALGESGGGDESVKDYTPR